MRRTASKLRRALVSSTRRSSQSMTIRRFVKHCLRSVMNIRLLDLSLLMEAIGATQVQSPKPTSAKSSTSKLCLVLAAIIRPTPVPGSLPNWACSCLEVLMQRGQCSKCRAGLFAIG